MRRVTGRDGSRRRLWIALGIGLILVAGFAWVTHEATRHFFLVAWDGRLTDLLVGARTPGWNRALWSLTLLGNSAVMVAVGTSAVLLLVAWGRRSQAVLVAFSLLAAQGMSQLMKAVINRSRPPEAIALIREPGSFSLPSGHAFLTLVMLGLLALVAIRAIGAAPSADGVCPPGGARSLDARSRPLPTAAILTRAVILAAATALVLLVGLSRVYLGVHWASDVLAGWCLGGVWLALSVSAFWAWEAGGHRLPDTRPWGGARRRLGLALALALITVLAVFLTARSDPLLASVISMGL